MKSEVITCDVKDCNKEGGPETRVYLRRWVDLCYQHWQATIGGLKFR